MATDGIYYAGYVQFREAITGKQPDDVRYPQKGEFSRTQNKKSKLD
jgi:hypothetical protein